MTSADRRLVKIYTGCPDEDKQKRRGQFAKNALMFNAPVGMFAYIDRSLSYGQWMDLGMYLQSVILLCEGMDWPHVRKDIGHFFMRLCVRRLVRLML